MTYSCNEVEALAKNATRGAGYDWGFAEEAAKATRWLCQQSVDGVKQLAGLLQLGLAQDPTAHIPQDASGTWQASGSLCPLMAGALLSDTCDRLRDQEVLMVNVAQPMLLLPFAANAARRFKTPVSVDCGRWQATTDGEILAIPDHFNDFAGHVRVQLGGAIPRAPSHQTRAAPNPDCWETLRNFAQKTYAPATEESRLLGAGDGGTYND